MTLVQIVRAADVRMLLKKLNALEAEIEVLEDKGVVVWLSKNSMDKKDNRILVSRGKPVWCPPVWLVPEDGHVLGSIACDKSGIVILPGEAHPYRLTRIRDGSA